MLSLCWPRLTGVYDTSHWVGDVIETVTVAAFCGTRNGVFDMHSSRAMTFCAATLGSVVSSTSTCVGCSTVADVRPGPLTLQGCGCKNGNRGGYNYISQTML